MGLRSGCSHTLMGQPPLPVVACTKGHVNAVHVGAFLAVHLDVDEKLVHHGGGRRVLERFVRHDVAPVARRITDGQKDGFVLAAGLVEGLLAPRIPIDRVVRVLEQVGRFFPGQPVDELGSPGVMGS